MLKTFREEKLRFFSKCFLFGLEWSLSKKDKGIIDLKGKRAIPINKFCLENLNFQVYNICLGQYWSEIGFSSGKSGKRR